MVHGVQSSFREVSDHFPKAQSRRSSAMDKADPPPCHLSAHLYLGNPFANWPSSRISIRVHHPRLAKRRKCPPRPSPGNFRSNGFPPDPWSRRRVFGGSIFFSPACLTKKGRRLPSAAPSVRGRATFAGSFRECLPRYARAGIRSRRGPAPRRSGGSCGSSSSLTDPACRP